MSPQKTETKPDVSVVVTAHHEGTLAHHTLRSLSRACDRASEAGLRVEVVLVLDRPDAATVRFLREAGGPQGYLAASADVSFVEVDHGDLGLSRNSGIAATRARVVGVLDADNLVSSTWIVSAYRTCIDEPDVIVHPTYVVTFEARRTLWHMVASNDERFRPELLCAYNYWDAFSMAQRSVYIAHPYVRTGRSTGLGPEDWHWNVETHHDGLRHVLAPETALFYRVKRTGSLMSDHESGGSLAPPSDFLLDAEVAARAAGESTLGDPDEPLRTPARTFESASLRRILRRHRGRRDVAEDTDRSRQPVPAPPASLLSRLTGRARFDAIHYRLLNPDLAEVDDGRLVEHFRREGRAAGRRALLDPEEHKALAPEAFHVDHYRVLHPDLAGHTAEQAISHLLTYGRAEGRQTLLTPAQLAGLDTFDPEAYRRFNPDLRHMSEADLVAHFLRTGITEQRRSSMTRRERHLLSSAPLPDWLLEEWRQAHHLDTRVPVPTPAVVDTYSHHGHRPAALHLPTVHVWWRTVAQLGERPDVMVMAPWLRMGGGDRVLTDYVRAVRELRPDARICVVTTLADSTHSHWLPEGVTLIELPQDEGYAKLSHDEQTRLVANLVVQTRPQVLHVFNSPHGFDAVERFPLALSGHTNIFLSTFVVERGADGEINSWLSGRPSAYLDPVNAVLSDTEWLGNFFWELDRMPREKFGVHHHPVVVPDVPARVSGSHPVGPLRVMWAARFDRQKRLDILASIVEECRARHLPVCFDVFGAAVMPSTETDAALDRLTAAGVVLHPPYRDSLSSLPLGDYGLFLMTSEWEGVPLTLLDAMVNGLPVLVPPVGGVAETVDDEVGFVTSGFDVVEDYVEVLAAVATDPTEAERRALNARERIQDQYSWTHFLRQLEETPDYLPRPRPAH